jgi:uncharacterized protein YegL
MEKRADQKRPERAIPVYFFFICDSSATMGIPGGNSFVRPIDVINHKIPAIIGKIGKLLDEQSAFKGFIRVLTCSEDAEWQNLDNIRPASYVWNELHAYGKPNLGATFIRLAKALKLREHRGLMRNDGPIPIIILVLGSVPNDDWKRGLEQLNAQYWGEHAIRFSVTYDSCDLEVITCFLGMNDNHSHSLSIDQIDELPSRMLAVLEQRNVTISAI